VSVSSSLGSALQDGGTFFADWLCWRSISSFHPPTRLQTLEKIIQHRNFMKNQRDSATPHVVLARTYPNLTQLKPSEYLQTNKQPLIPHLPRSPFYGLPHPPSPPLLHPKPSKLPKHTKPPSRTPTPFFRSLIIELLLDSLPHPSHTTHLEQCFMLESRLGLCEGVMRTVVIAKRCRLKGGWGVVECGYGLALLGVQLGMVS